MINKIRQFLKRVLPAGTRGFTLIETLVAVLILATSITGPLSIASRSLNTSLVAKDQIIAFFLAQDAVEYVHYARDSNTLAGGDWLAGAGSTPTDLTPCASANGCYLDATGNSPLKPTACGTVGCVYAAGTMPALSYDPAQSRFTYATGSGIAASLFTRTILITSINTTEQKITVTVSWKDVGGTARSVSVNENIFAWQ